MIGHASGRLTGMLEESSSTGRSGRRFVSLVMPVWRPHPEWLREAVSSALGQQRVELELIVVDDGCPQPVGALLEDVADDRLRIVRIEHGGTSAARNAGMSSATGAWFRFVDCDDVLEPGSTQHLLDLADDNDDVIAYGATTWCDEELRPGSTMVAQLRGPVLTECLLGRFQVTLPSLLFPRRVVEKVGEWDPAITVCQDWDFVLRALEHAHVRGDDRVSILYRRHPGGASAGTLGGPESLRLGEQGMRRVVGGYFERHPEQRGGELERKANAGVDLLLARSYREAYLRHLGHALRNHPAGVVRELRTFGQILAHKVRARTMRAVRSRLGK